VPGYGGKPNRKLPAGKFWTKWWVYVVKPDGTEKRKPLEKIIDRQLAESFGILTKPNRPLTATNGREVLKKLIAQSVGISETPDTMATFKDIAEKYIAIAKPGWLSANTRRTTEHLIRYHLIGGLGQQKITSLDALDLQDFLNRKVEQNLSQEVLTKLVRYLRAIFDIAVVKKYVITNPAKNPAYKLKAVSKQEKSSTRLDWKQVERLFQVLDGRDRMIIFMFLQLGPRPEELFALRPDDMLGTKVRFDEAIVDGVATRTKTPSSKGFVNLAPELAAEIANWIKERNCDEHDWLFPNESGGPWDHKNYLNRILKPAGVRAGLLLRERKIARNRKRPLPKKREITSGLNFQILRRTSETFVGYIARGDVKLLQTHLRHASPAASLKFYQETMPEAMNEVSLELERRLRGGDKKPITNPITTHQNRPTKGPQPQ
jgi:integrase